MEATVLAVLAFLGVTLALYGAFGRPDQSRPRCTRCGVDVRSFAWDAPPTCSCGARLARPGSVRTRGRVRRPRFVACGLVLLALVVGLSAWTVSLTANKLHWLDSLPLAFVEFGIERGDAWAINSVERRLAAGRLSAGDAARLLSSFDRAPPFKVMLSRTGNSGGLIELLADLWASNAANLSPEDLERELPIIARLVVGAAMAPAHDGEAVVQVQSLPLVIATAPCIGDGEWLVRIERVELNGVPAEITVAPAATEPGRVAASQQGRRVIVGSGTCSIVVPADAPSGAATVVMDLILARTLAAPAAPGDDLIDSTEPPERWGVPALVARVRRSFEVTITSPEVRSP